MTTLKHISTEYQGGLPWMIGQSPAQEFAGKERDSKTPPYVYYENNSSMFLNPNWIKNDWIQNNDGEFF
jgi:hypothetical protein